MKTPETPPTFESMLVELETVVHDLEDGAISLDDALARYEKGVGLLRGCFEKLKNAEQKIQQLMGVDDDGQPILKSEGEGKESTTKPATRKNKRRESADDEM